MFAPGEYKCAFLTGLAVSNLSNLIWRFKPLRNPRPQVARICNLLRTSSRRRSPFQGHLSDEYQQSVLLPIVSKTSTQVANSKVQRLIPTAGLTIMVCFFPNSCKYRHCLPATSLPRNSSDTLCCSLAAGIARWPLSAKATSCAVDDHAFVQACAWQDFLMKLCE